MTGERSLSSASQISRSLCILLCSGALGILLLKISVEAEWLRASPTLLTPTKPDLIALIVIAISYVLREEQVRIKRICNLAVLFASTTSILLLFPWVANQIRNREIAWGWSVSALELTPEVALTLLVASVGALALLHRKMQRLSNVVSTLCALLMLGLCIDSSLSQWNMRPLFYGWGYTGNLHGITLVLISLLAAAIGLKIRLLPSGTGLREHRLAYVPPLACALCLAITFLVWGVVRQSSVQRIQDSTDSRLETLVDRLQPILLSIDAQRNSGGLTTELRTSLIHELSGLGRKKANYAFVLHLPDGSVLSEGEIPTRSGADLWLRRKELSVGASHYRIEASPTPTFIRNIDNFLPLSIIISGVLISFLVGLLSQFVIEQLQSESRLDEHRRFLQQLIDRLPFGVISQDARSEFKFAVWNQAASRILDLPPPAEMIGRTGRDFPNSSNADRFFSDGDERPGQPRNRSDSTRIDIEKVAGKVLRSTRFPIDDEDGQPRHAVALIEDISPDIQRIQRAEDMAFRLSETNQRLRSLVENLPGGAIFVHGDRIEINRAVEWITGFRKDELRTLDDWFALVAVPNGQYDRASYERQRASFFEQGATISIHTKDGKLKHVELVGYRDESSEIWIVHDLTERMLAEERFRVIFDNSHVAHFLVDGDAILDCNAAATDLFGYSREELLSIRPRDLSHDFLSNSDGNNLQRFEWIFVRKDGSDRFIETNLSRVKIGEKDLLLVGCTDVTSQKDTQIQIANSSRMASLGEVAASLAHEINNPLGIIKGKAQHILLQLDAGELRTGRLRGHAQSIVETVNRVALIVKGLKNLSRESRDEPLSSVCLNTIIEETIALCSTRFQFNQIRLDFECDIPDEIVLCRPIQISQVLLNLLINSLDAVMALPDRWVRIAVRGMSDRVEISVTDSGAGIPENIQYRLMKPFFTTKSPEKGTGLGLSISHKIMKSHDGDLYFDPQAPNTRFVAVLPRSSDQKGVMANA